MWIMTRGYLLAMSTWWATTSSLKSFVIRDDILRSPRVLRRRLRGQSWPDDVFRSPRGLRRPLWSHSWPDDILGSLRGLRRPLQGHSWPDAIFHVVHVYYDVCVHHSTMSWANALNKRSKVNRLEKAQLIIIYNIYLFHFLITYGVCKKRKYCNRMTEKRCKSFEA